MYAGIHIVPEYWPAVVVCGQASQRCIYMDPTEIYWIWSDNRVGGNSHAALSIYLSVQFFEKLMCCSSYWLKGKICQEYINGVNAGDFGYCIQESDGFIRNLLRA